MPQAPVFRWEGKDLILTLKVQPRASKSAWGGLHEGAIKLRLAAPPVEGQANQECLEFLAKALKVSKSAVQFLQGQTSKHKVVRIQGASREIWEALWQQWQLLEG